MFDPVSLWMQSTVMWMKVFKQQHDAYLKLLGSFAEKIPHETAADIAREAEAAKKTVRAVNKTTKPAAPKQSAKDASLVNA
ncbi:MAG: hypothetical protein EA338_07840 [Roseinatronobacter sp.]|jgi:hypothetical protein|nr:MAG: hypothetical protein EA338_07840 [Roseinatronobacter sp.]